MEFRRLDKNDVASYFANRLRALQDTPSAFLVTYEEEKANGPSRFEKTLSHEGNERAIFGALVNGEVVGTIGIFKEDRPKMRHRATIWGMFVDREHRKKKAGNRLVELAIEFAKNE